MRHKPVTWPSCKLSHKCWKYYRFVFWRKSRILNVLLAWVSTCVSLTESGTDFSSSSATACAWRRRVLRKEKKERPLRMAGQAWVNLPLLDFAREPHDHVRQDLGNLSTCDEISDRYEWKRSWWLQEQSEIRWKESRVVMNEARTWKRIWKRCRWWEWYRWNVRQEHVHLWCESWVKCSARAGQKNGWTERGLHRKSGLWLVEGDSRTYDWDVLP